MLRSRIALVSASSLLAVGLWASAAHAHAVFQNLPSGGLPANTEQTLRMEVPHEWGDDFYNIEVRVQVPKGWAALGCQRKSTWTCSITTDKKTQLPVITFTKDKGSARAEDEFFTFTVRTPATAGEGKFSTIQVYNSGQDVAWIGEPGSPEPAPVITAYIGTPSTPKPTPTPSQSHSAPSTAPSSKVTTSQTPSTTASSSPTPTASPSTTDSPDSPSPTSSSTTGVVTNDDSNTTPPASPTLQAVADSTNSTSGSAITIAAILGVLAAGGAGVWVWIRRRSA